MLIKSKDGKTIVNTNTLIDLRVYGKNIYCSVTHDFDERGYEMGVYETEDEAQAALNKLFESINEPKYDLGGDKNV